MIYSMNGIFVKTSNDSACVSFTVHHSLFSVALRPFNVGGVKTINQKCVSTLSQFYQYNFYRTEA